MQFHIWGCTGSVEIFATLRVVVFFLVGSAPASVLESPRPGRDAELKAPWDVFCPIGFRSPLDSGIFREVKSGLGLVHLGAGSGELCPLTEKEQDPQERAAFGRKSACIVAPLVVMMTLILGPLCLSTKTFNLIQDSSELPMAGLYPCSCSHPLVSRVI